MRVVHRVDQGTPEWHRLRLGIPTASRFHQIITPKTAEFSKQARPYMYRLVAERLLGEAMEDNLERVDWIERGTVNEPRAVKDFSIAHKLQIEPIGFITDDQHRWGCSPDALIVNRNEAAEIKCPQPWTQVGRLLDGITDDKYRPQVQGQLFVGELDCVHFYSWHPRTPAFYLMTLRDEEYIAKLAEALRLFVTELDRATNHARRMGWFMPQSQSRSGPAAGSGDS